MPTIVVSGHARKTGKTSVVEGLIRAFPEYSWLALKVSTHWHSESSSGEDLMVYEENNFKQESDSSRFLAAGAARSFWVRMRKQKMALAMPKLQSILQSSSFVIIEGNQILNYVNADIHVMVMNCNVEGIKESAWPLLKKVDVMLVVKSKSSEPLWKDILANVSAEAASFETEDPLILPSSFLDLIRSRITGLIQ
jgi:molybdopterin-guanine dinucleotide biosynthesis protein